MSEPIDVPELLVLARETLQNDVAPNVPAGARFAAAMVANALAIAARELRDDFDRDLDIADAREALPEFGDDAELIAAIRGGLLDEPAPQRNAAKRYAAALLNRRLAVTNPGYLEQIRSAEG
jgi:Domain of unknown function (DUF6285)